MFLKFHPGSQSASPHRRGFTLIELLVVLAIISVLAAIIFPVLSRARDMGRRAVCLSNLKQIGMGLQMYVEDYDGKLPGTVEGPDGAGKSGGWIYYSFFSDGVEPSVFDVTRGSLYSYISSKQIYICPSDSIGRGSGASYAYNSCLSTPHPTEAGLRVGKSQTTLQNADTWMVFCEEDSWMLTINFGGIANGGTNDGFLLKDFDYISQRHAAGSLVAFADGHAKWYREDKIRANNFQTGGQALPTCPP